MANQRLMNPAMHTKVAEANQIEFHISATLKSSISSEP